MNLDIFRFFICITTKVAPERRVHCPVKVLLKAFGFLKEFDNILLDLETVSLFACYDFLAWDIFIELNLSIRKP